MGTTIKLNNVPIGQIMDITGPGLSTDTDDITNHSSPDNTEEKIATVKRLGDVTFDLVYNPEASPHAALFAAWEDRSKDAYIITMPDDTGQADAGASWDFDAYVTAFGNSMPVTGHYGVSVTLTIAAAPTFNPSGS